IDVQDYIAFLTQAYYHVRHTTPLLMAVGSRISMDQEWLREAVGEYIKEEMGHQEWVLNDIEAAGGDRIAVLNGTPSMATELMVSYAYDTIHRVNPLAFFGMVLVLEGTSIKLATRAADTIQKTLGLEQNAFSYLQSHGSLDIEHMDFLESLINRIEDADDKQSILHAANNFYYLYAEIFRTLEKNKARAA
ncbi:MAG: iron-containing redox enzyme family protein, partial [Gammaproteobacteria bacterium]|nr:iron-containing redox enzyme family protein [Gammaproteobacteria bacterium]